VKAKATCHDGILGVTVPVAEVAEKKRIEITPKAA
jgi:HSP20 family molecular chaperone IbpA